jgi:hypothetical protein
VRVRRAVETLLVATGLAALTAALTWPAVARLATHLRDTGDPVLTAWTLAWDLRALETVPLRLFDANMFHPHRWTLAYTEHLLGLVPLAAPAHLAGGGPVLVHNVVWLATFPLAGVTTFWLVRDLTGHAGAAAVAAVLYAFSHFRFGQLGHVQVLSHAWLPLLLLGLHRAARDGARWRDLWLAALAFTLQALSSAYHAVFSVVAVGLFGLWLATPAARPPLGRLLARGGLAAATVAVLLAPAFLPYALVDRTAGLRREPEEIAHYVARPASYLAAPAENRWLGAATAPFRARALPAFPGVVMLALAVPVAVGLWRRRPTGGRRRRWPRWPSGLDLVLAGVVVVSAANWLLLGGFVLQAGPLRLSQRSFLAPVLGILGVLAIRRIILRHPVPVRGLGWVRPLGWPHVPGYYVLLTAVAVLASFGPRLELGETLAVHPVYRQLQAAVPGFDGLRAPVRFGVLVTTGLAVLAGFGAAALARRVARRVARAALLSGLGLVAALEGCAAPVGLADVSGIPGPADRWLAARPGGEAVVVLPMYPPDALHLEARRLLGSTAHWRPLVNGYGGVVPPDYAETVATLSTFPSPAAVARLRAIHVRYAVVRLGDYPAATRAARAVDLLALPPGVTRAADVGDTAIFEVGPAPPAPGAEAGWPGAGPEMPPSDPPPTRGADGPRP